MIDLTLLNSLKIVILQIIDPFLPRFEMNNEKSQKLIEIINKIYDAQLSKLSYNDIQNLKNLLNENHFINSYVKIFQSSFSKIFQDGKINNDDIPLIINLVKDIVLEVNKSNQENTATFKINVSTIITLVKYILTTVSSFIFEKRPETIATITTIFSLVELSLTPISGNSFSCKFC